MPPELPRWRRILIRICVSGIVLISLMLVLDIIGAVRLGMAMAAARAGGAPLTYAEIVALRSPCPPEQDGASLFLTVQPLLTALRTDPALERISFRYRGGGRRSPLGYRWTDQDREATRVALERLGPALEQLDRLADLPGGSLPLVVADNVVETSLPQGWEVRLAARLYSLRALDAVERGDTRSLTRDTGLILRLARLVATHPTLVGAMMSCACHEQAVSTVERACGLAVLPTEILNALSAAFAEAEREDPIYWGVLGDRACFYGVGRLMLDTGRSPVPDVPAIGFLPGLRGLLMMDLAAGLAMHNRLVAQAREPGECLKVARELEPQYATLPRGYWVTQTLFPRPQQACQFGLRRLTRLRAARVGLAIERFRLDTGRFPEKLRDLKPAYLAEIPLDPFDGLPLPYRLDDQAAVVYSSADASEEPGWGRDRRFPGMSPDTGFTLLPPDQRGRPASRPSSAPGEAR